MTNQFPALQMGIATLGIATGIVAGPMACSSTDDTVNRNPTRYEFPDTSPAVPSDAFSDAVHDAAHDAFQSDAGPCPSFDFNPPHTLRLRAYDIRYGGTATVPQTMVPFGGVFVRASVVLPSGFFTPDASANPLVSDFVGEMSWASQPLELSSADERVRRRVAGNPLRDLSRPGVLNWDEAFPGDQTVGFFYTVEGRIDRMACLLELRLLGAVNLDGGLATNQPLLALPFYSPRPDGQYELASADFGNEAVSVLMGGLTLAFDLRTLPQAGHAGESPVLVLCDNDCPTIPGSGLRRLEAVLIGNTPVPTPIDAGSDASADASTQDAGHDGGLVDAAIQDANADVHEGGG